MPAIALPFAPFRCVILLALLTLAPAVTAQTADPDGAVDPESGLVVAPGWELVRSLCYSCHSLRLVTGQRADRQTWLEMIRWMQETQGLFVLPRHIEDQILDYLASAYGPVSAQRRPPLPPQLMPPNPYGADRDLATDRLPPTK